MNSDDHLRLAFVGMHPDRKRNALEIYGSVRALLDAIESGRCQVPEHARSAARVPAARRRQELAGLGVDPIDRADPRYPAHLATLEHGPDLLFVRGSLPNEPGVAVVGSRKATRYGLALSRAFGVALARSGRAVISGLAKGIDAAAHRGTLEAAGTGVAVLGCGIDRWYPADHAALGKTLLDAGGAIVSEYPPGTPPNGWRFPPRNRIISGMSAIVVVVEAAVTGGALITARTGLDQGREVFAVPGDLERATSEGCNLLIRDGAWPLMGVADLIESVDRVLGPSERAIPRQPARSGLVELVGATGRTVDWIVEATGRSIRDVLAELARLEAAGLVTIDNGQVAATP